MTRMPPELRARILAEAARTPSPTKQEHDRRVLVIVAAGGATTIALFLAMGGLVQGTRPPVLVAFSAGLTLLSAIAVTRLTTFRAASMLGPPRPLLVAACLIAAPVLAAIAIVAAALWPEQAEPVPATTDLACGALCLVQGAAPLAILLLPRRGADPIHPALTGAALGISAGAWAAMLAYLRCPHVSEHHCIHAHVFPVLVLSLVGAVLGGRLLRVR